MCEAMSQGAFIDEQVQVEVGEYSLPKGFIWRGEKFEVAEILSFWRKLDFKKAWWRRRHRDYYRVRTVDGRVFELYRHRGPGRRYWVLLRELPPNSTG